MKHSNLILLAFCLFAGAGGGCIVGKAGFFHDRKGEDFSGRNKVTMQKKVTRFGLGQDQGNNDQEYLYDYSHLGMGQVRAELARLMSQKEPEKNYGHGRKIWGLYRRLGELAPLTALEEAGHQMGFAQRVMSYEILTGWLEKEPETVAAYYMESQD